MADESKKLLEKLRKLYEAQRQIQDDYTAKMAAISLEVSTLLGGGVGIGDVLKRLEDHYAKLWAVRYAPGWKPGDKGGFMWDFKKDRAQWKRLIARLGVEELELRIGDYMKDGDAFYVGARHPFGLFITNINRFTASAQKHADDFELSAPAVADCKHDPACKNDQEHTRRKMSDMRRVE